MAISWTKNTIFVKMIFFFIFNTGLLLIYIFKLFWELALQISRNIVFISQTQTYLARCRREKEVEGGGFFFLNCLELS